MRTTSGSSAVSGAPGMNPRPAPPTTSRIGYGSSVRYAASRNTATAARTPSSTRSSEWPPTFASVSIESKGRTTLPSLFGAGPLPDRDDRERGHTLLATDEADAFSGRGLDVHVLRRETEMGRDV